MTPDPDAILVYLLTQWDKDRSPRLADWALIRRSQLYHQQLAEAGRLPALPAPTTSRERIGELIAGCKEELARRRPPPFEDGRR